MTTFEISTGQKFKVDACCACGVQFAYPYSLYRNARDTGQSFYCPNGHSLSYKTTELDRLKEENEKLHRDKARLRRQKQEVETDLKYAKNSLRTTKGVVTKMKKRIGNGVCPCCNRHFTNLENHMKTKHPDYKADDV